MKYVQLVFPNTSEVVRARLLFDLAPKTCTAFWDALAAPMELIGRHAMYTGRELSIPMPADRLRETPLKEVAPENLTCFPARGDLLYTYLSPYAWSGAADAIFDLGCFYGRDARTFFPAGWLPGNRFAEVVEEDRDILTAIGQRALQRGEQQLVLQRESGHEIRG